MYIYIYIDILLVLGSLIPLTAGQAAGGASFVKKRHALC